MLVHWDVASLHLVQYFCTTWITSGLTLHVIPLDGDTLSHFTLWPYDGCADAQENTTMCITIVHHI